MIVVSFAIARVLVHKYSPGFGRSKDYQVSAINTDLDTKKLLKYALKGLAVWLIVMFGIIWYTFDSKGTLGALRAFQLIYVPLLLLLVFGSWLCSGARLWVLSRAMKGRLTFCQAFVTGIAAEFGVAATPGGVGGTLIRIIFLRKSGFSLTVGASIIMADAILDVLFFVILMPFALIIMKNDPSWSSVIGRFSDMPLAGLAGVFVILLIVGAVILKKGSSWARWFEDSLERIDVARRKRLSSHLRYARWKSRNALVRVFGTTNYMIKNHFLSLGVAFVLTSIQWLCRYGVLPVVLMTFAADTSFLPLIVVQGILLVMSFVVILPGGGGAVDVLTTLVLKQFVPASAAGVIQVICRIFTYHLYLLAGGTAFFLAWGRLDKLFPPEHAKTG